MPRYPHRDEFVAPDFGPEVDLHGWLESAPATSMMRMAPLFDLADRLGGETQRVVLSAGKRRFEQVSQADWHEIALSAACAEWPDVTPAQALRLQSRELLLAFAESVIGKVLFGQFDGRVRDLIDAGCTVLGSQLPGAEVTLVECGASWAVVEYRALSAFYLGLVSIFESLLHLNTGGGRVLIRADDPHRGELLLEW